jgi:hypothetical protein
MKSIGSENFVIELVNGYTLHQLTRSMICLNFSIVNTFHHLDCQEKKLMN